MEHHEKELLSLYRKNSALEDALRIVDNERAALQRTVEELGGDAGQKAQYQTLRDIISSDSKQQAIALCDMKEASEVARRERDDAIRQASQSPTQLNTDRSTSNAGRGLTKSK